MFLAFHEKGCIGPVDVDLCKSVYHNTDELRNEIVRKNGTPIGFCNLQVNL